MIASLALIDKWSADRIAGSFDGGQYRPQPLTPEERRLAQGLQGKSVSEPKQPIWVRLEFPAWLEPELAALYGDRLEAEMAALMAEAETDLRANTLKATREEAREALAGAQKLAARHEQQHVDVEHLLLALLQQEPGLAPAITRTPGAIPAHGFQCAPPSVETFGTLLRWPQTIVPPSAEIAIVPPPRP